MLLPFTVCAQSFVLTISTDKSEYLCGEPVVLSVSLQNTANTSAELPRFLDPKYYEVEYEINGKRFIPWILIDDLYPTKTFAPFDILREEVMLFFNGKEYIFPKPGEYTITAKLRGQSSNTLKVTCGKNTSVPAEQTSQFSVPAEQTSQLLLDSHAAGYFLLFEGEGAQFLTEGVQVLQQIANNYPTSPLATYANQALGNSQAFLGNYQEALPYLKAAQQNPVGLYDIVHTSISLYQSYMGLGNTQEAKSVLEELDEKISEQFSDFKPFVDAILRKHNVPQLELMICLYAVHDEGISDSQLFTINPAQNFEVKLLGKLYPKKDIEALDINPITDQIFVTAIYQGMNPGHLYKVDAHTGDLSPVGTTTFREIDGLSFKPDGSLWGWAAGDGLISINTQTGLGKLQIAYSGPVEDITWDNSGEILYGVEKNNLLAYDGKTNELSQLNCTLPGGEVESLEMLPDGRLLFGIHEDKTLNIYALDIKTCSLVGTKISTKITGGIKLSDVEGIAWSIKACSP
jgi:tetratricopeptide (TPR) repeat protein